MSYQQQLETSLAWFRPIFNRFAAKYGLSSAHDFSDGAQLYLEWRSAAGYRCFITLQGTVPPEPLLLGAHCFPPSVRETHWVDRRPAMSLPAGLDEAACWATLEEYRTWAEGLREPRLPDGSLDFQPILDALRSEIPGLRAKAAGSLVASGRSESVPAVIAAARAERDPKARGHMIRALDKLDHPEATEVLLDYLLCPGVAAPWEFLVQGPAALALARRGNATGIRYLLGELREAHTAGRRRLRWTSNHALFEALNVPLYTSAPEVACVAAEAIALLPEYAIPVLTHAKVRVPPEVQVRIEQILSRIMGPHSEEHG